MRGEALAHTSKAKHFKRFFKVVAGFGVHLACFHNHLSGFCVHRRPPSLYSNPLAHTLLAKVFQLDRRRVKFVSLHGM